MAGRMNPPRGIEPPEEADAGRTRPPRNAPQKSSGEAPTYLTSPPAEHYDPSLFSGRPSSWLGVSRKTLPTRRLEGKVPRVLGGRLAMMSPVSTETLPLAGEAPREGDAPGLDAGFQGAEDQVFAGDVARADLQFDLPRLGVDVVDDDVASGGRRPSTSPPTSLTVTSPASAATFNCPESPSTSTSPALGLDLHGAARRNSERVVGPCAPAPVGLDDDLRVLAGDVHGHLGGLLLGRGRVGAHRVLAWPRTRRSRALDALDPHLACGVGEAHARFRTG